MRDTRASSHKDQEFENNIRLVTFKSQGTVRGEKILGDGEIRPTYVPCCVSGSLPGTHRLSWDSSDESRNRWWSSLLTISSDPTMIFAFSRGET